MKRNGIHAGRKIAAALALAMLLVLVGAVMPRTAAYAYDGNPFARLEKTTTPVKFNDLTWYLIQDGSTDVNAGTVTLLSKDCVDVSCYYSEDTVGAYSGSAAEATVMDYYHSHFSEVRSAVRDDKLFLLTYDQASALPADILKCVKNPHAYVNYWWLDSIASQRGSRSPEAACVDGDYGITDRSGQRIYSYVMNTLGIRPAVKLDLVYVSFDTGANTFTVKPADPLLHIDYKYSDGAIAAVSFEKRFAPGSAYAVQSPEIDGFTADKPVVEGTMGNENVSVTVTYSVRKTNIAKAKIAAIKDQEYTGKAIQPKLKVTCDGWALARNRDYTVAYTSNKKIGQAVVTITGKGNYYGIKVTSFKINPKKMPSLSLKPGKKSLTVNWKAEKNIDGYEIEYSLKKDFKGSKIQKVKKAKTTKYVIKKLKAGKTYYVRIRSYKKVLLKTYYSKWSKTYHAKTNE